VRRGKLWAPPAIQANTMSGAELRRYRSGRPQNSRTDRAANDNLEAAPEYAW